LTPKSAFIKKLAAMTLIALLAIPSAASASPWAKKETYLGKTGGKFLFGLEHSLFSWLQWWPESMEKKYPKPWNGFCVGIGKSVVYTAAGLVQLATFPVPVDFPDIGDGIGLPKEPRKM